MFVIINPTCCVGLCPELQSLFAMTMTSTESGLPFPLKKGHIRQGSASADRTQIKGPGSQQEGVNDRESLSMEAVRDYGDEVPASYPSLSFPDIIAQLHMN